MDGSRTSTTRLPRIFTNQSARTARPARGPMPIVAALLLAAGIASSPNLAVPLSLARHLDLLLTCVPEPPISPGGIR
jgi:hypothetical protein